MHSTSRELRVPQRALRGLQSIHFRPPRPTRVAHYRRIWRKAQSGNGEPLQIQPVRFVKPPTWSLRRVATFGLYGGAVYAYLHLVWKYLGIEIEYEEEAEEREGETEDGDDEESYYAHQDSTFIPLTWATKMPRTFYRGSDPEWQEFIKVSRDKQRGKRIQSELVQMVFSNLKQHPGIHRQLGKELAVGKYWFNITFPDGPPQEYERSGIEIADDFIGWSQQKVSPENQWRLTRALWPEAAFNSLWATTKVLAGIQFRRVKQALGLEGKDPTSPEEKFRHALEKMQRRQQREAGLGKVQTDPNADPGSPPGGATPVAPSSRSSEADPKRLPWQISVPLPSSASAGTDSMDIPIAMHVFSSTLSKQWNPKKAEPPRGTFVVQGLLEVRGSRGCMMFDVQSCYDPQKAKYVVISAAVRSFRPWNQSPRGGP